MSNPENTTPINKRTLRLSLIFRSIKGSRDPEVWEVPAEGVCGITWDAETESSNPGPSEDRSRCSPRIFKLSSVWCWHAWLRARWPQGCPHSKPLSVQQRAHCPLHLGCPRNGPEEEMLEVGLGNKGQWVMAGVIELVSSTLPSHAAPTPARPRSQLRDTASAPLKATTQSPPQCNLSPSFSTILFQMFDKEKTNFFL